jgi:hypothetical protein
MRRGLARLRIALGYLPLKEVVLWLATSREITNFTYELTGLNRQQLISFVAVISDKSYDEIAAYVVELENDEALRQHIRSHTLGSSERGTADSEAKYGRRLGWYALVRALKPRVVVETGVDKGLGACVITAALRRNDQEGQTGRYYGTEIDRRAGYLLAGEYARYGTILYGDSIALLDGLDATVDLFIHDSDHAADYESAEYRAIAGKLADGAMVLSDNAHASDQLLQFACATQRRYLFFREQPAGHWYPGAGIGAAFD